MNPIEEVKAYKVNGKVYEKISDALIAQRNLDIKDLCDEHCYSGMGRDEVANVIIEHWEQFADLVRNEDRMIILRKLIEDGYISEKGAPLKCQCCQGTDFEELNQYYEEGRCIEYQIKCKKCQIILGHWAYGQWSE